MIRILEGTLREVEKLANTMETEGWIPLGPAVPNGRNPVTNAQMVMLTMIQNDSQKRAWPIELERLTAMSLNSVGGRG